MKRICWDRTRVRICSVDFVFALSQELAAGAIEDKNLVFDDGICSFENWVFGKGHGVIGAGGRNGVIINSMVAGAMDILELVFISAGLEIKFHRLFRGHGNIGWVRRIDIHRLAYPIQPRMDNSNATFETRSGRSSVRSDGVEFGIDFGEVVG